MAANPRALLVQDELLLELIIREALDELGCHAITTTTVKGALEFAATGVGPIDFAIVDLGLPDGFGDQAVRALRERWPGLPAIITTGYGDADIRRLLGDLYPLPVVRKPFTSEDLAAAIRALGIGGRPRRRPATVERDPSVLGRSGIARPIRSS